MRRSLALSTALAALIALATAYAQQQGGPPLPQPRITSIFPVAAQAGTEIEATVYGTDLDEPTGLLFSHPGITGLVLTSPEPAPDPKTKGQGGKAKTGPKTSVKFKIAVAKDVPLGLHDVRIVSRSGASNPRAFLVGDQTEVVETDKPHNDVPLAQKLDIGSAVSGTLATVAEADYYSFTANAGQRVLIRCASATLDSKARPQVELFDASGKRQASNRNLAAGETVIDFTAASAGDYFVRLTEFGYQNGGPDYFYRLNLSEAPFIEAVDPPFVSPGKSTQVTLVGRNLPGGKPVGEAGLQALVVIVEAPAAAPNATQMRGSIASPSGLLDAFEYSLKGPKGASNSVPIYLTREKVVREATTDNDKPETAQAVEAPCLVAGRIDKPADKDWYAFTAKKGEIFWFELHADRIGSGIDPYYVVKNATNMGNVVEEQDDDPDSLHPTTFSTRSADPAAAKFTAPADGKYLVMVGSRDGDANYGPRCVYGLRIGRAAPDFSAVAMPKSRDLPSCALLHRGGDAALDVFIDRRDGFNGPVKIEVRNLPKGVTAKPTFVGTGSRWGIVVLSASDDAAESTGAITLECTATIDGRTVKHPAAAATVTWAVPQQQNVPLATRMDKSLVLAVRTETAALRIAPKLDEAKVKSKDKDGKDIETKADSPIYVKPGDKLTLSVQTKWTGGEARPNPVNLTLEPYQPGNQSTPIGTAGGGNNNNTPIAVIPKDKDDAALTLDVRSTAAPGRYSLALRGDTQLQVARDPSMKDKKTPATVYTYADPFEVVVLPTTVAKIAAVPPPGLKPGQSVEMVVKVERLADYDGELKIAFQLPKDMKGVTANEATIPAGKDETKLVLVVAEDAKPAQLQNVVVAATGTVHGKFPIRSEVKINLAITK